MRKRADLSKALEPIYRVIYCGNCKGTWQMRGYLKVAGKKLHRTFTCPACLKVAKRDYYTEPTYAAIETRKNFEPILFYSDEIREQNKMLLEATK